MYVDVRIMPNKLDQFYRSLVLSKYFTKGWGKPENLKKIFEFRKVVSNRETCYKLVSSDYPVHIEREIIGRDYSLFDGYFFTPFAHYLPEVVPVECQKAHFQLILPNKWQFENYKPVVLQIAGTGDQYYWRRRNLVAKPLLREAGIGSIILENPFYGKRKPSEQRRTVLHNVSDIFVMGGCLILESMVLFHFCERLGYGPLGVTGLSMGGHMASLAATCWPKPIVVVPCLSGLTASNVFTQGVISRALNWDMLEKQFHSNLCLKEEIVNMIHINEGNAFKAGQKFVQNISEKQRNLNYTDEILTNFTYTRNLEDPFSNKFENLQSSNLDEGQNSMTRSHPSTTIDMLGTKDYENDGSYLHAIVESNEDVRNSYNSNVSVDDFSKSYIASIKCDLIKDKSRSNGEGIKQQLPISIGALQAMKAHLESGNNFHFFNSLVRAIIHSTSSSLSIRNTANSASSFDTRLNEQQALKFMNGIMDECTHLKNYPVPVDTSLVIAVCAEDDAYIPLKGVSCLNEIWPDAEVRYVKGGHVRAYIQCQRKFRSAIIDAFSRYRSKYINSLN